jgi:hypothetical protein
MEPDLPGPAGGVSPPGRGGDPSFLPSVREHLPSVVFGGALPIAVYFAARPHVSGDAPALIVAGCVSAAWILLQFVLQRRVDLVGAMVLLGFTIGVVSSVLTGGNAYMLKVRDAFFTALLGVACVVSLFTHERPMLFYVSRYMTAGRDPERIAAFDHLHEVPVGRHTFRVLSVVWGVGLVVEATARLTLADLMPTATFVAVSPFVTSAVLGSLFVFSVLYVRRIKGRAAALLWPGTGAAPSDAHRADPPGPGGPDPGARAPEHY